jgi:hypothetical protein|tara:strand:- start:54 stop:404 length:351 start_codon:yes stop_codon:yes gene_type:complete
LHKHSFVERETEFGSFTQLSVSSVAHRLDGTPKDLLNGVENYKGDLVDLEPNHSPETIEKRRAILAEERPHIRRFDYGDFWGRVKLRISGHQANAEIYQMLAQTPWKTIDLTGGRS